MFQVPKWVPKHILSELDWTRFVLYILLPNPDQYTQNIIWQNQFVA